MNGNPQQHIACRARRWTPTAGRQLALAGSLVACLLLASAAPVAAVARPTLGGIDDPFGRDINTWSDWSVEAPITQPISEIRLDRLPPEIRASVAPMAGPYAAGSEVRVDFTCTDSGSGVRWCPVQATLDTTFPGFHRVAFYVVDVAGNVGSTVIDYVVVSWDTPMTVFPTPRGAWV